MTTKSEKVSIKEYVSFTLEHIEALASDLSEVNDSSYVEVTKATLRKMWHSINTLVKQGKALDSALKCRELQDTIIFYEFDINARAIGVA